MPESFIHSIESSSHFKALFESVTIGIVVTNVDEQVIAINPYALSQFGYLKEEIMGKKLEELISPQKSGKGNKTKRKGFSDKDFTGVRKNGTTFPAEVTLGNYLNEGKPYKVAFITNISAQKKAESETKEMELQLENSVALRTSDLEEALTELQHSKSRLEHLLTFQKALLDKAGAIIIATDKNGVIKLFNPEASLKLGYTEAEVVNKHTPVLFHNIREVEKKKKELAKLYGKKFDNNFDVLVENARHNIHKEEMYRYQSKNGTSFPVSLTVTALRNSMGEIIGFMGIGIDISERMAAEKELEKLQQLFLQLLYNYPDGAISIIDRNFNFVYTGGELHRRLQVRISQLIGKEIYPKFPEPLRGIILDQLERVFTEKILISGYELPYQIANHTFIMDAFPLLQEDGSVNHIGVIIKNISKLKMAEESLREALNKERNLGELKSRFVSMASHEFRTPLSTVLSSAYLIEKYTAVEDQPKREKHLQRIISSVNLLTDILNEFLNIGKIEEGKLQAKFSAFDLETMIRSTLDEMKNNIKKEQQISYEHKGPCEVCLDSTFLKHIVMNLISNASKFSSDNSIIEIKTSAANEKVTLSVKDNGIGISLEDQKHLTERFFRASNAANIQGTGLGLHIIAKYTEMMDGKIRCKSELQKGTEFILTFPNKPNQYEENPSDRRQ